MYSIASDVVLVVQAEVEAKAKAAEAERRRVQAEALERERLLDEQRDVVANGGTASDVAALAQLEHDHRTQGQLAYLNALDATPDDLGKLSTSATKKKVLVVDDGAEVPIEVAGVCIRPIDEAAVVKLLKAGVAVPGCRLDTAKGKRTT
jgi:hypothetical protein